MRLLKISTLPANYWKQFYSQRSGLSESSYATQQAEVMYDSASWADFWSVALAKLGYETGEVISSIEPLQRAWAREHNIPFEANWRFAITTAQIKDFKPDLLFVNDYASYTAAYLRRLKSECPGIRLMLGWCGAPYRDAAVFSEYDIVLSSVPELVEDFIARGHRCFHINHAFDPRILERTERAAGAQTDFTFIGSIAKRSGFHLDREDLLLKLLERTPLEIWADTNRSTWLERSGVVIRQWAYDAIRAARSAGVPDAVLAATPGAKVMRWRERPALPSPINPRLARVARPPVFGLEMFVQLRHSRVTLNAHIDLSNRYASNMRLYEATGVGSCLLTDWRSNLPELFELDGEVVAYKSADECVEKVTYLLDHETERRSIAHAGQQRTLRCHTFDQRAAQLHDVIRHALMSK